MEERSCRECLYFAPGQYGGGYSDPPCCTKYGSIIQAEAKDEGKCGLSFRWFTSRDAPDTQLDTPHNHPEQKQTSESTQHQSDTE